MYGTTYDRILVPLDGSPFAEWALPFAEAIVRHRGRLVLVRAVQAHVLPGGDEPEAQRRTVAEAERYLAAVAGRLQVAAPAEVGVYYGSAAEGILAEIGLRDAGLVVMATHGRGGLGRAVLGSVADEVLRHAPVPVLLVPAARAGAWPTEGPLRILVPLDGSDFALEALGPVRRLAALTGADVTLLRAVEPPEDVIFDDDAPLPLSDMEPELRAARRYLEGVAGTLSAAARRVSVVATIGPAAAAIAEHVREHPVDLIAMATHGRGGFARLMLGSVAGATLRRAGVPLLLVRPEGLRVPAEGHRAPATGALEHLALSGAGS